MASLIRRGSKWYVAWRENGQQRRKALDTESKAEARKLLEVWHREAARDRLRGKLKNPTVAKVDEAYHVWAVHHLKTKTRHAQTQRWRDFIVWHGKEHRVKRDEVPPDIEGPERDYRAVAPNIHLGDIDTETIEAFKLHLLSSGSAKQTANNYLQSISARIQWAIKHKLYMGPNPCSEVERLRVEQSPPVFLSKDQIEAVLASAKAHSTQMYWFFMLGLFEGLRFGEIVNSRWEWFRWDEKLLVIPSDEVFSLKSHKARTVPLSARVIEAMQPHAQESGYLFEAGKPRPTLKTSGAWVYRYHPKSAFRTVIKRAGLADKGIGIHTLRHTFASQLAKSGVSIYKLREWLGHSDTKVTRIYAHVQGYDEDINRL